MTDAYKCDVCGEKYAGHPSVTLDIDDSMRQVDGTVLLDDEGVGHHAEFSLRDTDLDVCASCGSDIVTLVDAYVRGKVVEIHDVDDVREVEL
jgi:hypothetical protein